MAKLKESNEKISDLLRPEIISSIEGLELVARIVVEEFFHGNNRSHRLGMGQEFSQYRSYEPGDDLRLLDWKMYARSERYYIRQSEIDTHITIRFIIDASKSMEHESGGLRKIDLARIIVASLAYLARNQGDSFGLFTINNENISRLSPTVHPQQFTRLLQMLIQLKTAGAWPIRPARLEDIYYPGRKEMVIFLSDMYEKENELMDFITSLKTQRNEVLVLNMVAQNEIEFAYEGFHTFKDLETGEEVLTDADKAREFFVEKKRIAENHFQTTFLAKEIDYHQFNSGDDLPTLLSGFLQIRKRLV
ncbi:MAG TPA: DUF58 domain-containing protein [Cyclobacteriaceae bacterium]|jgi:uncharacterized protein (DUF58 family)